MDAIDEIEREDQEKPKEGEEAEKILTHNYEDYYNDNFKKNEKGEIVVQDGEKVEIDTEAFADEDDLDDLPDDI